MKLVELTNVKLNKKKKRVFDLEVENEHSYIANGYVVHNCITSSNTGIHFPMASLIEETYEIKKKLENAGENTPFIIADGGIRNYSDVIKALVLGADYVMIGGMFSSLIESAAKTFTYDKEHNIVSFDPLEKDVIREFGDGLFDVNDGEHILNELYKVFYGMASREGQIDLNGEKTKTSEGIMKILPVTTNINKWTENMMDYLRSAMSYTNVNNIKDFNPFNVRVNVISNNTKNSINK